jgi:hypothetical protein
MTFAGPRGGLGSTCAAFSCGNAHSFGRAMDWLSQICFRASPDTRVLSDFDTSDSLFKDAVFNLACVVRRRVDRCGARAAFVDAGLDAYLLQQLESGLDRRGVFAFSPDRQLPKPEVETGTNILSFRRTDTARL